MEQSIFAYEGTPITELDETLEVKETPDESQAQTNQNDTTVDTQQDKEESEEKKVPFNEHPRFKELIEEKNQLKAKVEELSRFKQEAEPLIQKFEPKKEDNVPSWFGGSPQQWQEFQNYNQRVAEEAKAKAIAEIETKTKLEQDRINQANSWFEENIQEIEKDHGKVDRNKLLKTVLDYQLVDPQGRWNYKAGFQILKASEPVIQKDLTTRKKIAEVKDLSTNGPKKVDYKTPADLKKGWFDY